MGGGFLVKVTLGGVSSAMDEELKFLYAVCDEQEFD